MKCMALARSRRRGLVPLLLPSVVLLPVFAFYLYFEGAPHFFLHALSGWDVALVLLLAATYAGRHHSRWDGLLPLALALYAMAPDFVYAAGPYHRDWMDVFLFHVALDEVLTVAVPVLALLWVPLLAGYVRFRLRAWPSSHAGDSTATDGRRG